MGNTVLCGRCCSEFTYSIENHLKEPFFEADIDLPICRNKTLVRYMEDSVMEDHELFKNFQVTFTSPYGYYVDTINNRKAVYKEDKTYWRLKNEKGSLNKGVSTYVPNPGEHITIELVKDDGKTCN